MNIRYMDWWNGPHLTFPDKITSWYPIRINCLHEGKVACYVGKLEGKEITYGVVDFPENKFTDYQEDQMGEIAFYGEDYLIKLHTDTVWDMLPELKAISDKCWPIIEKSRRLSKEKIWKEYYNENPGCQEYYREK